jgi:hypothetical protein
VSAEGRNLIAEKRRARSERNLIAEARRSGERGENCWRSRGVYCRVSGMISVEISKISSEAKTPVFLRGLRVSAMKTSFAMKAFKVSVAQRN